MRNSARVELSIVVDDLRPQLNVAYGQYHMKTPYLDKLAQSGGAVTFTRAYAQVAHCAPSRNSFMTSRYPDSLKIYNVNSNFREVSTAADPIFPIPQWFKRNGYHVYGGGKIYHPNHPPQNDNPFSWSAGTKFGKIKYFNDHDHGCDCNSTLALSQTEPKTSPQCPKPIPHAQNHPARPQTRI